MFNDYLLRQHKQTIIAIISSHDTSKHHSIIVEFLELFEADPNLGSLLLRKPEEALQICDKQLLQVQNEIQSELSTMVTSFDSNAGYFDENMKIIIHVRVHKLPGCPEFNRYKFPLNADIPYMQLSGIVTRISAVKLLEYKRDYVCKKCRQTETVTASYSRKYDIEPPARCSQQGCNSIIMIQEDKLQAGYCKDYQEIKIQEDATLLGPGMIPNSLWVILEDDLADICKPGDSVTICGELKLRWGSLIKNKKVDVNLTMKANHVSVHNDKNSSTIVTYETKEKFKQFWMEHRQCQLAGRDKILRSFCPESHGMYLVKLAVAVILAGGSKVEEATVENASRVRTEPHLLLVGDPGTGKSQLLRFATKVIPRSVMTTGIGSTSAGLTVTAIMENGEWQLEAGALVLSDGGICCIDEFNSMREHDRMSIHEAMEQQSISVAKANIVCKLHTRCSILAAANPKGSLDIDQPLSCNIAIASPLLSRFDLILILKDIIQPEWDEQVAQSILSSCRLVNSKNTQQNGGEVWSLTDLQAYYVQIRNRNPTLTSQTREILSAYYQYQRKREGRNQTRTTVRLLDSLIRLSQAHAKIMYHEKVAVLDAVMAIALVDASMDGDSFDVACNAHVDFLDDPDEYYRQFTHSILDKLNLKIDITDDDVDNADGNTSISSNEENIPGKFNYAFLEKYNKEVNVNHVSSTQVKKFVVEGNKILRMGDGQGENENNCQVKEIPEDYEDTEMNAKQTNVIIQPKDNESNTITNSISNIVIPSKGPSLKEKFGFLAKETTTNEIVNDQEENNILQDEMVNLSPLKKEIPQKDVQLYGNLFHNQSIFEEDHFDDDLFEPV